MRARMSDRSRPRMPLSAGFRTGPAPRSRTGRASGRRVLASTELGFPLELDVDVDVDVEVGARGGVLVRRASAYPLRG